MNADPQRTATDSMAEKCEVWRARFEADPRARVARAARLGAHAEARCILELGCGNRDARHALSRCTAFGVTGVDLVARSRAA